MISRPLGSSDYLSTLTWDLEPRIEGWLEAQVAAAHAAPSEEGAACDGLHDAGAPLHYLCSRCFPDRGDLLDPEEPHVVREES